jgi:hypothetical protein
MSEFTHNPPNLNAHQIYPRQKAGELFACLERFKRPGTRFMRYSLSAFSGIPAKNKPSYQYTPGAQSKNPKLNQLPHPRKLYDDALNEARDIVTIANERGRQDQHALGANVITMMRPRTTKGATNIFPSIHVGEFVFFDVESAKLFNLRLVQANPDVMSDLMRATLSEVDDMGEMHSSLTFYKFGDEAYGPYFGAENPATDGATGLLSVEMSESQAEAAADLIARAVDDPVSSVPIINSAESNVIYLRPVD